MKKIVLAGLVAISMIALSQQQASAWVNQRFSVGLNFHRQSGGNNLFWGGYRNGQVPGPESFGGGGGGGDFAPNFTAPMPQSPHAFMPPSNAPQGFAPQTAYYPPTPAPTYAGQAASPYQFANYPRQTYYYYPAPAYYYYYGQ